MLQNWFHSPPYFYWKIDWRGQNRKIIFAAFFNFVKTLEKLILTTVTSMSVSEID